MFNNFQIQIQVRCKKYIRLRCVLKLNKRTRVYNKKKNKKRTNKSKSKCKILQQSWAEIRKEGKIDTWRDRAQYVNSRVKKKRESSKSMKAELRKKTKI